MKKYFRLIVFFSILACASYARIGTEYQMLLGNPSAATTTENNSKFLVQRAQFAMDYSNQNREPNWVSWNLTAGDIGTSGRSSFTTDTNLPSSFYVVQTSDYSGSGFDRGHMCPSADRTVTVADNQAVFVMSNMVPQAPDNNQGIWANFETYCRTLATAGNELLIIAGPSKFGGATIASGVAVPGYVWKIVVVVPAGDGSALSRITTATRVIAIKVPNTAGVRSTPWEQFICTAAQIEADTGYTFFANLPADVATALRNKTDGQTAAGSPTITTQPVTQTAPLGSSATFTVVADANGNPPLTYQWIKDDADIPGATNATLTLSNLQAANAGSYVVVCTNTVGAITSANADLVITGIAPSIATAPAAKAAAAGTTASFTVAASGSPTLSYQWRKGTTDLVNGGNIAGATSPTLVLSNVQAADAGNYTVAVTNSVSSATSAAAALTVTPAAPTITSQPVSKSVAAGGTVSMWVVATGTNDTTNPLTYQWRKNSVALSDGGTISGATTATLTVTGAVAADAATYDVVVSNGIGTAATSNAVTLTVNPVPVLTQVSYTGGTYTQNFDTLPNTTNATFTAVALYDLNPVNSALQGWSIGASSGTLSAVTVGTGSSNSGALYSFGASGTTERAIGTLASGSVTPRFGISLTNNTGATITQVTVNYVGEQWRNGGNTAAQTLKCSYSVGATDINTGTFTDSTDLSFTTPTVGATAAALDGNVEANRTAKNATITGLTWMPGQTLVIRWSDTNDSGNDHAIAVDDFSFSTPVTTAATVPSVSSTSPANSTAGVTVSSPITISFDQNVAVSGSWFAITSTSRGTLAATVTGGPKVYTLTPPVALPYDDTISVKIVAAQVTEVVANFLHPTADYTFSFSTESSSAPTPPKVTTQPSSQSVAAGGNISFTVAATSSAALSYQWRFNGTAITGNATATTNTLTLTAVTATNVGSYDCVVSSIAGSDVSKAATLSIAVAPPTITTQPIAQTLAAGASASFTVAAAGDGTLTYQWRKDAVSLTDGARISGSGTATLTVSGLTLADEGSYDVVVTNSGGSTPSSAAKLCILGRITYNGGIYSQSFDGLPSSGTFTLSGAGPFPLSQVGGSNLAGWSIAKIGGSGTNALFTVGTGSSNTGSLYSFGASGSSERALGAVLSGTTQSAWGVQLVNNTGTTLNFFKITYRGEQWRRGGSTVADKIAFEYLLDGTAINTGTFVAATAGDFNSVLTPGTALTADGAVNYADVTATIGGISWGPGQVLVLRWRDVDATSSDDGLAIDDFTFTAGAAIAPTVSSVTPANSATNVAVSSAITVTFSQPVIPSGTWYTLTSAVSGSLTTTVSGGPTIYTITPSANLPFSDTVTLTIVGTQVTDQSSGTAAMAANHVSSFSTTVLPIPTFTTHPSSQTGVTGDSVTFTVVATGTPTPTLQWQRNGTNITGATQASYTVSNLSLADDGAKFKVVATNTAGSTTSNEATLTVQAAPTITTQPQAQKIEVGQTATFTVAVTGKPAPAFQWQRNGTIITGATNATLTLLNVQTAQAGNYAVVVSNAQGTVTSSVAILTVTDTPSAPKIMVQPRSATVNENTTVVLSVGASANPAPTYQWRKDGVAITNATNSIYIIDKVKFADSGNYVVVVSNVQGTVTSDVAAVKVNGATAPTITTQPSAQTVSEGGSATFTVVADGNPAPQYQWIKDGVAIAGATNTSLVLSNVHASDAATYSVVVSNVVGSVTSTKAKLTVNVSANAPKITTQPIGASVSIGGTAVFAVVAEGTPAPSYQWRKGGKAISGATNPSLTFTNVQTSDAGSYDVVVTNEGGSATSAPAVLEVKPAETAPVINRQPVGRTIIVGAALTLSVDVTGNPAPTYQWRKGGVAIAGAISADYSVSAVVKGDAGSYDVVVTNKLGSVTSSAAVVVVNEAAVAPSIKEQPASSAAIVGQAASFKVVAVGNPTPTYQWRKNGTNISGATAASYSISAAQTSDEASYDVVVTNSEGAATSSIARLTVNPAPVAPEIFAQPRALSVVAGHSASFRVGATGAPVPTIQWQRNGVAIAGATSATYVVSNAVSGDAGEYSAVVTNSAGSVTSSGAKLTVMRRSYAGTYFGNLGAIGFFSIYIREDNTGVFLGFLTGTATPFVSRAVYVDDNGRFTFSASTAAGRMVAASALEGGGSDGLVAMTDDFVFSGVIGENGSLSGSVSGAQSLPMAATRSASTGSTASSAGFYEATVAGTSSSTYTIVSPTGQAMVLTTTAAGADAGTGTADSAGKVEVTTVNNQTVTATVSTETTQIAASVKDSTGKVTVYTGASDEVLASQRLVNVSTRSRSSTGSNVAIAGFVIGGEESKTVLIRAVGPTLAKWGVSGAMTAPKLDLYLGSKVIATNSGWSSAKNAAEMAAAAKRAMAFDLDANSTDAVIFTTLAPGSYTAAVSNSAGTDGVALVEVYDLSSPAVGQKLLNISTRSVVGTGENMMIAGFVVSGSVPKRVLIRAVGPTLANYGLAASSLLARPQVELLRGSTRVAINAGYAASADAAAITAASAQIGAFPLANNNEAALILSLEPGNYTAQVSGVGGTSGIAIIEVYEIQ